MKMPKTNWDQGKTPRNSMRLTYGLSTSSVSNFALLNYLIVLQTAPPMRKAKAAF